jgi:fatty-acyl-CoA synthase
MNVFGMLERSARSHYGHEPAIAFEGTQRSFGELRDRALAVAHGLRAAGVARGDRVAVLMGNRHEWPELLFGLAAAGAICVPVNVLLAGPEISHVCDDSDVRALVIDELGEPRLAELAALPDLVVTVGGVAAPEGARGLPYDDLVSGRPVTRAAA